MDNQYNEVIATADAWSIADQTEEDDHSTDVKPTISSRRVKSLIEQVTGVLFRNCLNCPHFDTLSDRYVPLPHAIQQAHFLVLIQLPLLEAYHHRISSSLVAFETLSSIFVRAVPGALTFSARETASGHDDPRNRTSGTAGAISLCKALLSATYMGACLEKWGEDMVSRTVSQRPRLFLNTRSSSSGYGKSATQTRPFASGPRVARCSRRSRTLTPQRRRRPCSVPCSRSTASSLRARKICSCSSCAAKSRAGSARTASPRRPRGACAFSHSLLPTGLAERARTDRTPAGSLNSRSRRCYWRRSAFCPRTSRCSA